LKLWNEKFLASVDMNYQLTLYHEKGS